jgi:hypothetical protein
MYDLSRGADCDSGHYLVVATVIQRLSVSKQGSVDMERFHLNKLNVVEVKEENHTEISNRFE